MSPSTHTISWSGRTDAGRFRRHNEDAFLALQLGQPQAQLLGKEGQAPHTGRDYLFAVSDGLGGGAGGEYASREAVAGTVDFFARGLSAALAAVAEGRVQMLNRLIDVLHQRLTYLGRDYEETRHMGATFTLAWLRGERLAFVHLGDSRLYHLPATGGITQLSDDHSHVGWLRRTGKIGEYEARMHPQRHQLDRCLGARQRKVVPQLGSLTLSPGDGLLLCSDGINDGLSDNGIDRLIREPPPPLTALPIAERLINESRLASGRDTLTALAILLE